MDQLHRRFTDEQIKFLFRAYSQCLLARTQVQEILGVGKTRFFALLKQYRQDPGAFSVCYTRATPSRLSPAVEAEIERELLREKEIVEDPRLPISGYNYSALRDRLAKNNVNVSVNTIINRAKRLACHKSRKKRKVHDRQVRTTSIGALIQHDSSLHLWSPLAEEKWRLITSIDDFSRKLLFADFFPTETTWTHIQATQTLMQTYGIPLALLRRLLACVPLRPGKGQRLAQTCPSNRRRGHPVAQDDARPGRRCVLCPLASGQRKD